MKLEDYIKICMKNPEFKKYWNEEEDFEEFKNYEINTAKKLDESEYKSHFKGVDEIYKELSKFSISRKVENNNE